MAAYPAAVGGPVGQSPVAVYVLLPWQHPPSSLALSAALLMLFHTLFLRFVGLCPDPGALSLISHVVSTGGGGECQSIGLVEL